MYDIEKALRRFKGLIKWVARRYAILGNFRMSQQDLEGEGYLVLVKCCRAFQDRNRRFDRFFKRSLYNHLKNLFATEQTVKRDGQTVDLVEAFGIPNTNPQYREKLDELIEDLRPHLSIRAHQFLVQLAEPDLQVIECAWREFCRRNKLHSLGQSVNGYRKFRVRPRHIRQVLGWRREQVSNALKEIRLVFRRRNILTRSVTNGRKEREEKGQEEKLRRRR